MCTNSNEKNKSIKRLLFSDIRWHFGAKQVKEKLTNTITGKVKTKAICMSIQKAKGSKTKNNHVQPVQGSQTRQISTVW